ncbi:MAG: hypothetical protein JXR83_15630 [Deltaproteobacteria bacterium]|nr:hypothetical protein [Deltaproteobacteria bacterium]
MSTIGRMMFGSTGMMANRMLDALGLPSALGDLVGARIDASRGDWAGYARNMDNLVSGMSTAQYDMMFGTGLPPSQFVPRPYANIGHYRNLYGGGYAQPYVSEARLGYGAVGRNMENCLLNNPDYRMRMERKLGGMIIPDGRADGRVTVLRYRPMFSGLPLTNALMMANPLMGGVFRGLSCMQANMSNMMNNMCYSGFNMPGANANMVLRDPETAHLAQGMGMQPPLSFEDLLFLMMMKYARKKEKEILNKMNELSGKGGQQGGGYGNFLGSACSIGGTVLGGLYGGFPLGTMIGGQLGSAVGGMVGGGQGTSGAFGNTSQESDTLKQMQMQKLMEDLKKMYEMLSNVMKSMHDMQMAAVRNLR